ncbi:MAG: hypothetical protein BWZ10_00876 [candidate division BRC1 bacterium ADurb.BinA364]|nr:MAG: hypothetical protein BWZ10_00876 [candidate division BRC1 bacterium ADurb.BinA364]
MAAGFGAEPIQTLSAWGEEAEVTRAWNSIV